AIEMTAEAATRPRLGRRKIREHGIELLTVMGLDSLRDRTVDIDADEAYQIVMRLAVTGAEPRIEQGVELLDGTLERSQTGIFLIRRSGGGEDRRLGCRFGGGCERHAAALHQREELALERVGIEGL